MPRKLNSNNYYPLILALIVVVLFVTNYKQGTWLLGWDNLQSELNLLLNLKRNFYGAWQEYQGLGLASGHAHTVEFVRLVTYFWLFLLPQSIVRYLFHFLMLFLGSFFVYKLCKDLFFKNLDNPSLYSFFSALFYLLSLGTMQNFYAPLEAYSVFYAFLPLLTLYFIRYIDKGGYKNLLLFSIANVLIAPAYHIQTYFIVVSIFLILPLGTYSFINLFRGVGVSFKRFLMALGVVIVTNLFWLLNVVYFVQNNVAVRLLSHINRFSTYDNFLKNVQFGNLYDIPLLRGFWFRNIDYYNPSLDFSYMMKNWIIWYGNNVVVAISYLIFVLVIIGIFFTLKQKIKYRYLLLYFFLLPIFFLFNLNGPLGFLYSFLSNNIALFAEVFRFPFTKFVIPSILIYSILFGFGVSTLQKLSKKHTNKLLVIVVVGILYYALPAFKGNLIYDNLKVDLPSSYNQTIKYFSDIDTNQRIVTLPQENFWDWKFNGWGFRGGGFLWYGIEQPILDRAFDVWNPKNEQYYNELQYALYSENTNLLAHTLSKYQVNYIILDKSVIAPGAPNSTFIPQTQKLLQQMATGVSGVLVSLDQTFGDIEVYKVSLPYETNKWVYTPSNYLLTNTSYDFANIDSFTDDTHVLVDDNTNVTNYPFADDNTLAVAVSQNNLKFSVDNFVSVPNLSEDSPVPASLSFSETQINIDYLYPRITDGTNVIYNLSFSEQRQFSVADYGYVLVDGQILGANKTPRLLEKGSSAVFFDKKFSYFEDLSNNIYSASAFDCGGGVGEFGKDVDSNEKALELYVKNKNVCAVLGQGLRVTSPSVVKVEFEYKVTGGGQPLYCLSEGDTCLNDKYNKAPQLVNERFNKYVDFAYVNNPSQFDFVAILESLDKGKEQSASFKNIRITIFDAKETIDLSPSSEAYLVGKDLVVGSGDLTIDLPFGYSGLSRNYLPGDQAFSGVARNCDNFNKGDFNKVEVLGKYVYSALDAISCDTLDSTIINLSASYQVDFVHKNIASKSLDICFGSGPLQKCMLQERLNTVGARIGSMTNDVITESFILPSYPSAQGIDINISNQSIGKIQTINELYAINVRYIPYEWLKGISVARGTPDKVNELEVMDVKKTHTYKYEVTTNGKEGLLVLNQSFDKGWIMFSRTSIFNFPKIITNFRKVGNEHVLVNNWANGWLVGGSDNQYTILFWPQYLQFLGYFMLVGWFVALLLVWVKSRLKNTTKVVQ